MRIETPQELLTEGYAPTAGYFTRLMGDVRPEIQALSAMVALVRVQDICEEIAA